ncbi:MAG: dihydrofolate reductase [Firmicutes bacterium]|nr:dihydrofolate reductase [Bacillota bacterium]
MNAIVAVDRNWGIGRDNDLLIHLPGDLKYYKEKTIGNVIIVGQRTLESFPGSRPLPGRTNIVLSDDPAFAPEGCIVCRTKEEVLEKAAEYDPDRVFICGGASIYRLFLEDCSAFYVTKIDEAFEADTFFPDLDALGYHVDWASEPREEKGIRYRFERYVKE